MPAASKPIKNGTGPPRRRSTLQFALTLRVLRGLHGQRTTGLIIERTVPAQLACAARMRRLIV